MSDYLTCEADLNFPGPTLDEVVDEVRTQYKGRVPVPAAAVAKSTEHRHGHGAAPARTRGPRQDGPAHVSRWLASARHGTEPLVSELPPSDVRSHIDDPGWVPRGIA